ncbi:MAG: hypothetical protein ACT4OO_13665 [Nitrospiraceae bacterium]
MLHAIAWVFISLLIVAGSFVLAAEEGAEHPAALSLEPPQIDAPFNEKDFASFKKKGKGTIAGQAFFATGAGEAKYLPGVQVYLIPATGYTTRWFEKLTHAQKGCEVLERKGALAEEKSGAEKRDKCRQYLEGLVLPPEKRVVPYLRITRADPTGHFWFYKVSPGRYFITTIINWYDIAGQHGGIASAQVELETGEEVLNIIVAQ